MYVSQKVQQGNYTFTLTLQDRNEDPMGASFNFDINIEDTLVAVEVDLEEDIEEEKAPSFTISRISNRG